jgi:cobyrinic acid a,c-diamide synthase
LVCQQEFTERLLAVQIIGQHRHALRHQMRRIAFNPAPGRVALTILFLGAILGHDELRFHDQHLGLARADQRRNEHRMGIAGADLLLDDGALRTVHRRRREILCAIQGAQQPVTQAAVILKFAGRRKPLEHRPKGRSQMFRRNRIQ